MLMVFEFDDRIKEASDNRISINRFNDVFVNYVEGKLNELANDTTDTYDKKCRDFNYFIDDVKDMFINHDLVRSTPEILRKVWESRIDKNLPGLMQKTTKNTCVRVPHDYEKKYRDLRKDLEDFCDEKTERLAKLKVSNNYVNDCFDYNNWVNNKRNAFITGMTDTDIRKRKMYLRKSDSCDLNNLSSLFLNIICTRPRDVPGKPSSKDSGVKDKKKDGRSDGEVFNDVNGDTSKETSSGGDKDKSVEDRYDVGISEDGSPNEDIPIVLEEPAECKDDDCFDVIEFYESHKTGVSPIDIGLSVRCPLNYHGIYRKGNKLYRSIENRSAGNSKKHSSKRSISNGNEQAISDNMDMEIITDRDPYSAPCFIPEEETCKNFVQDAEGGKTGKGICPHSGSSNNNVVPKTEVTLHFVSPDRDRINPPDLIYNLMNDDLMSTRKFLSVSGGNDIMYISHSGLEDPTNAMLGGSTMTPKAEKSMLDNIKKLTFSFPPNEDPTYESSSLTVPTSSSINQVNNDNMSTHPGSNENGTVHKKDEMPETNRKEKKIYSYFFNGILVIFIIFIIYQIFMKQSSFLWFSKNDKKGRIMKNIQEKVTKKMRKSNISEKFGKDIVDMKRIKSDIIHDRFIRNIYNIQYRNEIDEEIKDYIQLKDLIYDDEEKKKKKKYHEEYEKKDFQDDVINKEKDKIFLSKEREWKWKTIIEIHMEVLEDCKNEEWEKNKGDFLEICIEEFMKEDNEFNNNIKKNKDDLLINKNEDIYFSNVIEKQIGLWNKWIERHRYMIEKWKKEDWFCDLKETLKNEFEEQMDIGKVSFFYENNREHGKNFYLEKQKIIWKRWITRYVKHVDDYIIEIWFKRMMDELEKAQGNLGKSSCEKDEIINIESNHDNLNFYKKKKKKLINKIWIQIHMLLLEEYKKEECKRSKNILLDNYIDMLKSDGNEKKNMNILEILIEMKKKYISENEDYEKKVFKEDKVFEHYMGDWKYYEKNYINEKENDIYKHDDIKIKKYFLENPFVEMEKDMTERYMNNIYDNYLSKGYEQETIMESIHDINDTKKSIEEFHKEEKYDDTEKKKEKWKTVIEIYMEVFNESKKDEWEECRGDFLQICLEEFIKTKDAINKGDNINKTDYLYTDENIKGYNHINTYPINGDIKNKYLLERQKIIWLKCIKRNKYILGKWKNEEWFKKLKYNWNDEVNKKLYVNNLFDNVNTNNKRNPMIERQKIIWRKWIAKHVYNIDVMENEEWFKEFIKKYEKEDYDYISGTYEIQDEIKKKKLLSKVFIDIYMMVLEDFKEEECKKNKEIFLDTYIDELKKDSKSEKNKSMLNILDEIKTDIHIGYEKEDMKEWKNKHWFEKLKKEWNIRENTNYDEIEKTKMEKIHFNVINNYMLEIQNGIMKKYWDDMEIQWIDYDNKTDWLKIAVQLSNNEKNVCKRRYDYIRNNNLYNKNKYMTIEEQDMKEDDTYDTYEKNLLFFKRIIKMYMELLDEYKKADWDKNKGDFLKIALEEFVETKYEKQNHLRIMEKINDNNNEYDENYISIQQNLLWNKWIERKRYIIEKWKNEEWFEKLKSEWKKEQNKDIKQDEIQILIEKRENNVTDNYDNNNNNNILTEIEKILWRNWLRNQKSVMEKYNHQKWFKDVLYKYEKELKELENLKSDYLKNDISKIMDEELDMKNREYLIIQMWMEIHMMILEDCKKDEYINSEEMFLDACIEKLKNEKNEKYKNSMLEIIMNIKEKHMLSKKEYMKNEWKKKEKLFEIFKKNCINEQDRNILEEEIEKDIIEDIEKNKIYINNNDDDIIKNTYIEKQKAICKKRVEKYLNHIDELSEENSFINFMTKDQIKNSNNSELEKLIKEEILKKILSTEMDMTFLDEFNKGDFMENSEDSINVDIKRKKKKKKEKHIMENDDENIYKMEKENNFININELELHKEFDNNNKVKLKELHTEFHKDEQEILSSQYENIKNAMINDNENYDNSNYMKNIIEQKMIILKEYYNRKKYTL
ncbi:surface-associated interspersed protein 8.2 (SURFIN 8.2) [Plasmodium reichenowi]|uniref:Surface-associated interspersed protein 8.2 (SURFIN 8.2) n=1 Tax=Plasmodium reichenowi TaxID=5854 RepID=A0A2P9DCB7_PLARE|nr:surface-associated interspersed protein 8.2 (SURFIN 8.2) [Plasmodium reichenowi]